MENNGNKQQNSGESKHIFNPKKLENLASQSLVQLANDFRKWSDDSDCKEEIMDIAFLVESPGFLRNKISPLERPNFNGQDLADLVNLFSKFSDNSDDCLFKKAIVRTAQILNMQLFSQKTFTNTSGSVWLKVNEQILFNLASVFSKWLNDSDCKKTVVLIGQFIIDKNWDLNKELPHLNEQELIKLANTFIVWPNEKSLHPRFFLERYLLELARVSDGQELANAVNAFILAEESNCKKERIVKIAQMLGTDTPVWEMPNFSAQDLVNVVNAFSGCSDNNDCKKVVVQIAKVINTQLSDQRRSQCSGENPDGPACLRFNAQILSDIASAFSKWIDEAPCKETLRQIAEIVSEALIAESYGYGIRLPLGAYHFNPQNLSDLANAFDKCPDSPYSSYCKGAIFRISKFIIGKTWDPQTAWPEFNEQELLKLANAISVWPDEASRLSGTQLREAVTTDGEGFASSRIVKTDPST